LKRITPIDGLRGIAIISVVLRHFFVDRYRPELQRFSPVFYNIASSYGWGVNLFFVISGFLIGGILINNTKSSTAIKAFFIRRIARIWPLYYFLVFAVIGFVYLTTDAPAGHYKATPWWTYLVFLQNFYYNGYIGIVEGKVTWSLAIEEMFYIIAPFILLGAGIKKVTTISLSLITLAITFRYTHFITSSQYLNGIIGFIQWVDIIAIGVLGASIIKSQRIISLFSHAWMEYFAVITIFAILLMASISSATLPPLLCAAYPDITGFLFLGVTISLANGNVWLGRCLSIEMLSTLGKYCYFIYLYHLVMLEHSFQLLGYFHCDNSFIGGVIGIIFTLIAASLSWKLIEFPLITWSRKKYPYQIRTDVTNTREENGLSPLASPSL